MPLSEDCITELEEFIVENMSSPRDKICGGLSRNDLLYGVNIYKKIKTISGPYYEIFGSNALGYTCYSLYKSKDGNIYIVQVNMQKLDSYCLVNNEEWFRD